MSLRASSADIAQVAGAESVLLCVGPSLASTYCTDRHIVAQCLLVQYSICYTHCTVADMQYSAHRFSLGACYRSIHLRIADTGKL